MVDRFDPHRDLDWKPLPMRSDIAGQYVRYSDLAEARAEIERLTKERDEARAQVAAAFEAAARRTESEDVEYPSGVIDMEGEELREILRALTPAHAKAAIESYGRAKELEGMQRAAEIIRGCCPECQGTGLRDSGGVQPWGEHITVPCDCTDAILGGMETIV